MKYAVRPITDRAGLGRPALVSDFTATWPQTLTLLERELDFLGARNIAVELDVLPGQLTKDGQLKARSRASSGAVRLAFDHPEHGPVDYGTAVFERGPATRWRAGQRVQVMEHDWQHNLRAIALALEDLRRVDRYRVGRGAQYAGFKALGAGSGATPLGAEPAMTRGEAAHLLSTWSGVEVDAGESGQSLRARYRVARAAAHPDRNGGSRVGWDAVQQAGRVLGIDQ